MSQKFAWLPVKDADLATLKRELCVAPESVSYTHLTLPTILRV